MNHTWPALALLALSCAHAPAASQGPRLSEYYPLAVGNTWSYDVEILGEKDKQKITILSEENGFFKDSAGTELTVDAYGIRDQKRYLLRGPVEVGTKWNNVVSVSAYEQYQIVEAGQDCDSPAGAFHGCVVVECHTKIEGDKTMVLTLTFAPNVGIVNLSTTLEASGKQIPQTHLTLTSYTVQPAAKPAPSPAR
jgi:hypothetical protein